MASEKKFVPPRDSVEPAIGREFRPANFLTREVPALLAATRLVFWMLRSDEAMPACPAADRSAAAPSLLRKKTRLGRLKVDSQSDDRRSLHHVGRPVPSALPALD